MKLVAVLLAIVVLAAVPKFAPPYYITLVLPAFAYGIALLGFNLLFGYTGLLSFGHALFVAVGAYSAAVLSSKLGVRSFELVLVIAGLVAVVAAVPVALLSVRYVRIFFGILTLAFGMLFPERPIYLYFLLPVRAKYFVALVIGFDLFYGVTGTSDGVAHFAHLGGAAMGFLYILADRDLIPVRRWFAWLRPGHESPSQGTRWGFRERDVQDAKFFDIHTGKPPEDKNNEVNQEVIDAILDKISKGGYQSLTEEERRILNEASRKIH